MSNSQKANLGGGKFLVDEAAAQQVIGREGETATFFSRCPLNVELREFGFAPRQFGRSTASLFFDVLKFAV